jgi:hypothetical protein
VVGVPCSFEREHNCKATEEIIKWRVSGDLPPGIRFSDSGEFSGTPRAAGTFPLVVTVYDTLLLGSGDLVAQGYTLTIRPTP